MVIEVCLGSAILFLCLMLHGRSERGRLNVTVLGNVTFILNGESLEAADADRGRIRTHADGGEKGASTSRGGSIQGDPHSKGGDKKGP